MFGEELLYLHYKQVYLNVKGFKAATAINAFADISLIPVEYANSLFKFAKGR